MKVRGGVCFALGAALTVPAGAQASCAAQKPADQLRKAKVAFVGRLVDRDYARMTFAVDEQIKGVLGKRVQVRDQGYMTSVGFSAPQGRKIGLVLRVKDGEFAANECDRMAASTLRAAKRRGDRPCPFIPFPTVKVLELADLVATLEISSTITEGRLGSFVVRWGDGHRRTVKLKGRRGRVRVRHQYREPGLYKGSVVVTGTPAVECGFFEQSKPTLMRLRFR